VEAAAFMYDCRGCESGKAKANRGRHAYLCDVCIAAKVSAGHHQNGATADVAARAREGAADEVTDPEVKAALASVTGEGGAALPRRIEPNMGGAERAVVSLTSAALRWNRAKREERDAERAFWAVVRQVLEARRA
jgi:hypothetical protein